MWIDDGRSIYFEKLIILKVWNAETERISITYFLDYIESLLSSYQISRTKIITDKGKKSNLIFFLVSARMNWS